MKKSFQTIVMGSLFVLAAFVFSGVASATLVEHDVLMTETGVNPSSVQSIYVDTGAIHGTYAVYVGYYLINIADSDLGFNGNYNSFCVDPSWTTPNTTYHADINTIDRGTALERAAWLLSQSTQANAVVTQLAVWETVFDYGSAANLGAGYFRYSGNLASQVNTLLSSIPTDFSTFSLGGYYVATSPMGSGSYGVSPQDYIFHRQPVPEPGTLFLFGSGLIAAVVFRKRIRGK